jgi:hypothetical protein
MSLDGKEKVLFVFGAIFLSVAFSFLLSLPVMWLWDIVMPALFKLPEITWFQSWCLSLLCNLLFKSELSFKNKEE